MCSAVRFPRAYVHARVAYVALGGSDRNESLETNIIGSEEKWNERRVEAVGSNTRLLEVGRVKSHECCVVCFRTL
jgi:hypothetical protein